MMNQMTALQSYRQSLSNYGIDDSNIMSQMKSVKESAFAQHLQTFEDVKDKVAEIGQIGMDIASISGILWYAFNLLSAFLSSVSPSTCSLRYS